MATRDDAARYRENWQGEIDAVALYQEIAAAERNPQLAEIYRRLAAVEERHAHLWEEQMRRVGAAVPVRRPSRRARMLVWAAHRFGPQAVVPFVAASEHANRGMYDAQPEAQGTSLPADERSHARLLKLLAYPQGVDGTMVARLEGRHRAVGGNALRAAVLGANDGLVSNLSLVMGVAGASLPPGAILITGLAGLLAGASSMAIGEWISVQSSRELTERQLAIESSELSYAPAEEEEELALIYQAKGLPEADARQLAKRLVADPTKALDALAREELGINPEDLGGSPWQAALVSFFLFALGAVVPVLPFTFLRGPVAVWASLIVSGAALFAIGTAITLLTGRPPIRSGLRQLLIGLAAAGLTFAIGRLLGVNLAG